MKTTASNPPPFPPFLSIFFVLFCVIFASESDSHRAGSAHNALSLWLSLVSLQKFFGFDPGAGRPWQSPWPWPVWVGLSPWEGYIHWLVPAGAGRGSLGVVR